MTEITDLSTTDSSNTSISGESLDGAIANMGRMDNTLQATMGMLARSIRTNILRFLDNSDDTKRVALDLSGIPTGQTRTWTAPYYSGTLGLVSDIRGQIYGLTLSNNLTDLTNDIYIAAGSAVDSTGIVSMLLASGLTKRLDAVWAVGTNQGMLASGAAIANTTYHIFLIRRPDTGVVDVAADTSATGSNIAANTNVNYTQIRRIGSIIRSAGSIIRFSQSGDNFILYDQILDVNATNPGISAVLRTLSVPDGVVVNALLNVSLQNSGTAGFFAVAINPIVVNDTLPDITNGKITIASAVNATGGTRYIGAQVEVQTDSFRQVRTRATFSDASCTLYIGTRGWIDTRGRG